MKIFSGIEEKIILGISGSPRIGGNTDIILEKALEGARAAGGKTKKIILNDLDLLPCQEIEYEEVSENGYSVIPDDIQLIYQSIQECHALILASPIFFGSISAQTKIMIDRFQSVWISKNLLNKQIFTQKKPGAFLCTAASHRKDFFENGRFIVRNFFFSINVNYEIELFCSGVDKRGDILYQTDCLLDAFELGHKIMHASK
ncbi:MAG: flavodoxin family protein [Candidatus Aminicenantes bacterium]|nr:flavodoxin family protein [Candidatus Aminicenantes bacterium]